MYSFQQWRLIFVSLFVFIFLFYLISLLPIDLLSFFNKRGKPILSIEVKPQVEMQKNTKLHVDRARICPNQPKNYSVHS